MLYHDCKGKETLEQTTRNGKVKRKLSTSLQLPLVSSDVDKEWTCLICGEPFANWLKETWVQCLQYLQAV